MTARGRRRAAPAAAIAAIVLLAVPLWASPALAENFTISITSPGDGAVLDGSTATVSGKVDALLASVDQIRVQITRVSDGAGVDDANLCPPCEGGSIPFSRTSPALARNGPYKATITVSGFVLQVLNVRVSDAVVTRSFAVGAPPAAPTNVKAQVLDDRKVKVTWTPSPHPDMIGYAVQRRDPSKTGFTSLAPFVPASGAATFTDTDAATSGGAFEYRVVAVRSGAVPDGDSSTWLTRVSEAAGAVVPAPPTSSTTPGDTTPSIPPGGGTEAGGPATTDFGGFLSSISDTGTAAPSVATTPITLPDTGFSAELPFPSTSKAPPKVEGRQPGRSSSASASGEVIEDQASSDSNRRALLVPLAAGSVLCVAALHLRWLSRRLAEPAFAMAEMEDDLEPVDDDPDGDPDGVIDFALDGDGVSDSRQPVGAGASASAGVKVLDW